MQLCVSARGILLYYFSSSKGQRQRKETDWVFGSGGQKKAQDETFEGIVMPTWRRIEVVGGREAKTEEGGKKRESNRSSNRRRLSR